MVQSLYFREINSRLGNCSFFHTGRQDIFKRIRESSAGSGVDKTGRIEVEELVYSPVCGFVKMTSIPCESGEDKRQNKG